jgi:coniferyl-aldehyde dehydrogenase
MRILQEEIFGPLLPVVSYTSTDAVLGKINAPAARPLAIYYFGNSPAEERRVLDCTTSGAVTINDCMATALWSPFRLAAL